MTVRSERSLNRSKRQIGVFAIAKKDGGAHRVFLITQKYPIIAETMGDKGRIIQELEYILVTRDRLLNSDRSARSLFQCLLLQTQNITFAVFAELNGCLVFFKTSKYPIISPRLWAIK